MYRADHLENVSDCQVRATAARRDPAKTRRINTQAPLPSPTPISFQGSPTAKPKWTSEGRGLLVEVYTVEPQGSQTRAERPGGAKDEIWAESDCI